jgi:hypothetical protein
MDVKILSANTISQCEGRISTSLRRISVQIYGKKNCECYRHGANSKEIFGYEEKILPIASKFLMSDKL